MDGSDAMFDSRVIVEYLDTLSPVGKLIPGTGRERAEIKTWEALADGVLDAAPWPAWKPPGRAAAKSTAASLDRPPARQVRAAAARHVPGPGEQAHCCGIPLHPGRLSPGPWAGKIGNILRMAAFFRKGGHPPMLTARPCGTGPPSFLQRRQTCRGSGEDRTAHKAIRRRSAARPVRAQSVRSASFQPATCWRRRARGRRSQPAGPRARQQARLFGALQQRDIAPLATSSGWLADCDSTRNCTANSASTMPPGLCLTSKSPPRTGWALRTRSRMATISERSEAASRGAAITASRTASSAPAGPCGIAAALLLVVGVRGEAGHQKARVAIGPQRRVYFEQVAFAGLDHQPVDELAHEGRIDLGGTLVLVVEHEDDVQVAAVAQLLAAELAVADDGELRRFAVPVLEPAPAPARRHAEHAVGQGAEIVGDLLHRDAALDVARQRAKDLGVVGAAQQVEQGFVVVLARGLQGGQAQREFVLEVHGREAFAQHGVVGQLVDHARVLLQVACRPARRTQQVQQALMDGGALQQQGQVAFAAQQRLQPVQEADCRVLGHIALGHPLGRALHQAEQPGARFVAQTLDAHIAAPVGDVRGQRLGQLLHQAIDLAWRALAGRSRAMAAARAALWRGRAAQQGVELLGDLLAMGVELVQEGTGIGIVHGAGNPVQVVVARGQHMGLLVVQVLDAVFHTAQEDVGLGQGIGDFLAHEAGARQALQRLQRGAAAQLGKLPAAHHLQQLHGELDLADAAARQLDIVGPARVAGTAPRRVLADLPMQRTQRVKDRVVEIAAKDEGQHHAAQRLHLWPRVAVGPERQIHAEHEAVLGGVADQAVDALDRASEVFVVGDDAPAVGLACRLAVVLVDIDQVDVAGDIELARAELAHADDPSCTARPSAPCGCTMGRPASART
ncbi:hypothetical protein FQR65_LT20891 [Abscondita terminalis]|nr:hypothetical protein FQR65_LT20891 [Abscondita terminalis]